MEGKKVDISKDKSTKITKSEYPGATRAQILVYTESLDIEDDKKAHIIVTVAEDKEKYEEGAVRLEIVKGAIKSDVLVNMDVLNTVFRHTYARNLNELEKRDLRRKKMLRMYGWVKKLIEKIKKR